MLEQYTENISFNNIYDQLILEDKIRVGKIISPKNFKYYWQGVESDWKGDTSNRDVWVKDPDTLAVFGDKKILLAFLNWLEALQMEKAKMTSVYKQLQNIPQERVKRIIGSGGYGCVLDLDEDKVIKWIFSNNTNDQDRAMLAGDAKYYEYCLKNWKNDPYVPRIYKYKEGKYVVMEKLDTSDQTAIQEFCQIAGISQTPSGNKLHTFVRNGETFSRKKVMKMSDLFSKKIAKDYEIETDNELAKYAFDWCKHFAYDVTQATGLKYLFPGDCREANIGIRESGGKRDFVWFDI